jgi:hypothetical protein
MKRFTGAQVPTLPRSKGLQSFDPWPTELSFFILILLFARIGWYRFVLSYWSRGRLIVDSEDALTPPEQTKALHCILTQSHPDRQASGASLVFGRINEAK